jgi:myosin heavy subunit
MYQVGTTKIFFRAGQVRSLSPRTKKWHWHLSLSYSWLISKNYAPIGLTNAPRYFKSICDALCTGLDMCVCVN